ncbi:unnamed protein product [Sympodiomycopsis kandeliae]
MASTSAPLPADPKHKGTLACVVLKAKNLPNKRSIGKQDPFAVLSIETEKQKTKPDKRGGQHPTWDEQLHFEIYDDVEDVLTNKKDDSMGKSSSSKVSSAASGKKILKVACYADDNREPEFIGEGLVDLTGVLKTGEFDEWVTIRHKDRYCGEVYLELTFFSSGPRPRRVKKTKQASDATMGTYGGAGTFTSEVDDTDFAPQIPNKQHPSIPSYMRSSSTSEFGHGRPGMNSSISTASGLSSRPLEEVPPSLRPSSSLAGIATYTPPYAPAIPQRAPSPQPPPRVPSAAGVDSHHRSESFPSSSSKPEMHSMYVGPPSSSSASSISQHVNQPYPGGLSHSHSQSFSNSSGPVSSTMPSSFSTSSVASVGTIRPSSTQPIPLPPSASNDPIQDLIRPMSSMSVGNLAQHAPSVSPAPPPSGRPMLPPTPNSMPTPSPYQHNQSTSAPPLSSPYGHPVPLQQQGWEQPVYNSDTQRRPSYSLGPPSSFSGVSPTPPPHSMSAPPIDVHSQQQQQHGPPASHYHHHQHTPSYGQQTTSEPEYHNTQNHQIHPAQTFVPSYGSAPSPAPQPTPSQAHGHSSQLPPPHRPLSSSGYHSVPPTQAPGPPQSPYRAPSPSPSPYHQYQAGPPPPPQQQQQQQQQYAAGPPGSVINAQSLYDPYQQPPQQQDPYHPNNRVPSPSPSHQSNAPPPPMSSFSQPTYSSVGYNQNQDPYPQYQSTPGGGQSSRPLPSTTGLPSIPASSSNSGGYYNQSQPQQHSAPVPGLPSSPGYQPPQGYDHHQQQQPYHPSQQQPQQSYYPPQQQNDQARYAPSPYESHYPQQQQQQQQQQQTPLPPLPTSHSTGYYQ